MTNKISKNRVSWLDFIKGTMIFFVLLGHFTQSAFIKKYIYAFHMPLYFILSGCSYILSRNRSLKEKIKINFETLIIPYFIFNIIMIPLWFVGNPSVTFSLSSLTKLLIGIIGGNSMAFGNRASNPTWFLTSLFLVKSAYSILETYFDFDRYKISQSVILIAIIGYTMNGRTEIAKMPWMIDASLVAILYYDVGVNIMSRRVEIEKKLSQLNMFLIIPILMFIGLIFALRNQRLSMYSNNYGNFAYTLISSLSLSFGLILIHQKLSFKMKYTYLFTTISRIGTLSLYYMSLHFPIYLVVKRFYPQIIANEFNVFGLTLLLFIVLLPLSYLLNLLFSKALPNSFKKIT